MLRNQSVIDSSKFITEEQWVVSVLNTTGSFIEGHSAIVVEGVNFIGQYDISANSERKRCCNTEGHITKIKCRDPEEKEQVDSKYYQTKKMPALSYYVSPKAAKDMIASIKNDKVITESAMINWSREAKREPLILDNQGIPIRPLKYQKLGKNHFLVKIFGDSSAGDNCAGWCIDKLAVAGIGDGTTKPKPMWIAGQLSCSSLFKKPLVIAATAAVVVTGILAARWRP